MTINISPRHIVKILFRIVIGLTFLHCLLQFIYFGLGWKKITLVKTLFDFELDSNITTWYSSATLLIACLLLVVIAISKIRIKDPFARHWKFLAIIFAFLSLDEVAMLHERAGDVLKTLSNVEFDGWLYFQWVLIGIPVTLAIAVAYLNFLKNLPNSTKNRFILAGALFVGGALGLEMMAGHQESLDTYNELLYKLITTIEELWEKLGVLVFIHALLKYMEKYVNQIQISIGNNFFSSESIQLDSLSLRD